MQRGLVAFEQEEAEAAEKRCLHTSAASASSCKSPLRVLCASVVNYLIDK